MAAETFTFNIGKGRVVEFYNRVEANDPANSALVLVPLSLGGSAAQGQDLDTLAAVEADANFAEQTGGGWVRKVLTNAELAALPAPNDTDNRYDVQVPEITFTTPAAGNDVQSFLLCYDPDTTGGDDTAIIPLVSCLPASGVPIEADGNDVVINVGDFFRAS